MVGNNSKHKISSNKVSVVISYKVDTGSDGNIMPLHLYKKLFPQATKEQLTATKIKHPIKQVQQNNIYTTGHM